MAGSNVNQRLATGAVQVRPYFEDLTDRVVTALCVVTYDLRDFLTLPA